MAVPSKADQIASVVEFLDADDDRSLTEIATDIVNGMYKMWERDVEDIPVPLTLGRKFKLPWSSSIHTVTWMGPCKYKRKGEVVQCVWVTDAGANFGVLCPYDSPLWRITLPSTSKAEPKANALNLRVGQKISHGQGQHRYKVLATTEKAVLFASAEDELRLYADKNETIEKYYTWERK